MIRKLCQWENPQNKKKYTLLTQKTLSKIIPIDVTYAFLVEKEFQLN
jgi:hypothetical protein